MSGIQAVTRIRTVRPRPRAGGEGAPVCSGPPGPCTERLRAAWPQTRKQGSRSLRSGSWTTRTRGQVSKPRPRRERLTAVKRAGWTSQRDSPTTLAGALCTKGLLHSTWKGVVPDWSTTPSSESAGPFLTNDLALCLTVRRPRACHGATRADLNGSGRPVNHHWCLHAAGSSRRPSGDI